MKLSPWIPKHPDEVEPPDKELALEETDFIPEAFLHPGPDSGVAPQPRNPQDSSDELVDTLITGAALLALWQRADRDHQLVQEKVKALGIARELFTLI